MARASRTKAAPEKSDTPKAGAQTTTTAVVTSPEIMAAAGICSWSKSAAGGDADLQAAYEALMLQTAEVRAGNLKNPEAMLYGQAATLQTVFTALIRRAATADRIPQFQAAMAMALKAQAQCRATLETLAEIKNPRPATFVRQANIAHGPQQVNNGNPVNQEDPPKAIEAEALTTIPTTNPRGQQDVHYQDRA